MSLDLQCPSCGAHHRLRNPGVVVVVCEYCKTTSYREDAALRAGRRSVVAEPRSGIRVGETGRLQGEQVAVVGRVQFEHGAGRWDEWLLETADGSERWLVEDEKSYTLEQLFTGELPPSIADTPAGGVALVGGQQYSVRETGEATCTGGEGQLPRSFRPGERYRYVDAVATNGLSVLTVEIDPDGTMEGWLGRTLPFEAVEFAGGPDPLPGPTEAVRDLKCPTCGGGLELPRGGERPLTLACRHCTAVLNLAEAHPKLAGNRNMSAAKFDLEIGDSGALLGKPFEVIGRLAYSEVDSEPTQEYLLWNEELGYRWLDSYCGNWTLAQPTRQGPSWNAVAGLVPKTRVEVGETSFRYFEGGALRLDYVDGALPWAAEIGEKTQYATLIAPPVGLTLEKTGSEVECFRARHVDGLRVLTSFGRADRHTGAWEVGGLRPNPLSRWKLPVLVVVAIYGLLNLALAGVALMPGTELASLHLAPQWSGDGATSEPFEVPEGTRILGLHVDAPVDNNWVYVTGELLDASGAAVLAVTGQQVSYYHGYEGGESWSEGSKSDRRLVRAPPPGTYRLSVSREGDESVPVDLRLTRGDRVVRYPLVLGLLLLLYPLWGLARSASFEKRRWGEDEED